MDNECIVFLQWALPQLRMRWPGFRKVRNQVCKRIKRRIKVLELQDYSAYKTWIEQNPSEWEILDGMCRITISRFYRDWDVFDHLKNELLPRMAEMAVQEDRPLRCWSAGCASGEEPYTLSLIRHFVLKERFPGLDFQIVATDIDPHLLKRAHTGCYPRGSLKGLPDAWLREAFSKKGKLNSYFTPKSN